MTCWDGFNLGEWQTEINVRDFIQKNYRPYCGDGRFLSGPADRTRWLWAKCTELIRQELAKGGVLDDKR